MAVGVELVVGDRTVIGLLRLTTETSLPDPLSRDPLADLRLDGGQSGLEVVIYKGYLC